MAAEDFDFLFLIIARGGSKGVPRKNLRRIGGQSLIGFKAVSALRSRYCARVILSTEDAEIQEEGRRLGVEIPFTRPADLATDQASSDAVVLHAMDWIERNERRRYDAIILLEAASPFATAADYDRAVEIFLERDANLVVGMREMEVSSCFTGPISANGSISDIVLKIQGLASVRRQDIAQDYTMNGAFYLMRWDWYRKTGARYSDPANSYGVVMDRIHSIEIDSPMDLAFAEFLVQRGDLDMSPWLAGQPHQEISQ